MTCAAPCPNCGRERESVHHQCPSPRGSVLPPFHPHHDEFRAERERQVDGFVSLLPELAGFREELNAFLFEAMLWAYKRAYRVEIARARKNLGVLRDDVQDMYQRVEKELAEVLHA